MDQNQCGPLGARESKTSKFKPEHEESRVRQQAYNLKEVKEERLLHNNAVLIQALCAQCSGEPMVEAPGKSKRWGGT